METTVIHPGTLFAAIGAGIVTFGTAMGIGKLASTSVDAMARQPEAAAKIQTAMLIAAGMIEGVALFCAFICFQALTA
jgi:F-type H+-transporting ATPase subunit c